MIVLILMRSTDGVSAAPLSKPHVHTRDSVSQVATLSSREVRSAEPRLILAGICGLSAEQRKSSSANDAAGRDRFLQLLAGTIPQLVVFR
jgi:hypothetical protein